MEPEPTDALRSMFLAILIATSTFASVVALGGTAAAAANDATLAGDAEVELTGDASSVTQTVRFEAADTDPVTITYADFVDAGATLNADPTATNAAVETTGDDAVQVAPSSVGTVEVTFDWDFSAAESDHRVEYEVGTDGVPVRLLGAAAATVSDGGSTTTVATDETFRLDAGSEDTQIRIYEDDDGDFGDRVADLNSGFATRLDYDASGFDSGTYLVRFGDEGPGAAETLRVEHPDLNVTVVEDFVYETEDNFTVEISSSSPNAAFSLTVTDGEGTQAPGTETRSGTLDADGEATVSVAVPDEVKRYNVTVELAESGAVASTPLSMVITGPRDTATFSSGTVTEQTGDVAEISIKRDPDVNPEVTVGIGSLADDNYALNVTVEDGDRDGEIDLLFNTYAAGTGDQDAILRTADPDDEIVAWHGEDGDYADRVDDPGDEHLDSGAYNFRLVDGEVADFENVEDWDLHDIGTLFLRDRAVENTSTWVAPAGTEVGRDYVSDETGENLTRADRVATDEVLVQRVEAPGIEGALKREIRTDGDDVTEAFRDLRRDDVLSLTFDASTGQDLHAIDGFTQALTVVPDFENDTYYLVVDLSDLDGPEAGTEYETNVTLYGGTWSDTGERTATNEWGAVEATASLQSGSGNEIDVRPRANQSFAWETTVAPGTELSLVVENGDDGTEYRIPVVVDSNRTFEAETDLFADADLGGGYEVSVRRGAERLSPRSYDVVVRTEHAASVAIEDQEIDGTEWVVTVDSVTLEADGYVALYDESGEVVGVSDQLIGRDEPRESVDVELTADVTDGAELTAKVHRDEGEYGTFEADDDPLLTEADGNPATDTAVVSVPGEETNSAGPTTTTTSDEDTASGDNPSSGSDSTDDGGTEQATTVDDGFDRTESATDDESESNGATAGEDGPGFTALGLIAALLAAAVVLARRAGRD